VTTAGPDPGIAFRLSSPLYVTNATHVAQNNPDIKLWKSTQFTYWICHTEYMKSKKNARLIAGRSSFQTLAPPDAKVGVFFLSAVVNQI
jgi:hypothetical protein